MRLCSILELLLFSTYVFREDVPTIRQDFRLLLKQRGSSLVPARVCNQEKDVNHCSLELSDTMPSGVF